MLDSLKQFVKLVKETMAKTRSFTFVPDGRVTNVELSPRSNDQPLLHFDESRSSRLACSRTSSQDFPSSGFDRYDSSLSSRACLCH
jgi:hypothetical protein